jgi:hypothetical protein
MFDRAEMKPTMLATPWNKAQTLPNTAPDRTSSSSGNSSSLTPIWKAA